MKDHDNRKKATEEIPEKFLRCQESFPRLQGEGQWPFLIEGDKLQRLFIWSSGPWSFFCHSQSGGFRDRQLPFRPLKDLLSFLSIIGYICAKVGFGSISKGGRL